MKYSHLALAAMVSSFGLLACSDDPKPSEGNGGQSSAVIVGGDGLSSSSVIIEDPNAAIPSIKNEAVAGQTIGISGFAAVGPYTKGSAVSIVGVDPATLAPIGTAAAATVLSDKGDFTLQGAISSQYALVEVTGKYYNFFLDSQEGPLTLQALTNVNGRTAVNVNILTHIEAARVKNLIAIEGMTFSDAKVKADKEIRVALGLPADTTLFEDISFTTEGQAGANLLAISTIIVGERSGAESQAILQAITDDIALDGTWDDLVLKGAIGDDAFNTNVSIAIAGIRDRIGTSVQYFSGEIASIMGVQYGLGLCIEQYTVALNSNPNSANFNQYFVCQESGWQGATAEFLEGLAMADVFGACTEANAGVLNQGNGKTFICKKNYWMVATESEIANGAIAATAGACDDTKYGKLQTLGTDYYVCVPPSWTKTEHKPVDYTKGNAMNKILGKGMNFGNSWDSPGSSDGGWSNPIDDGDFAVIKNAGFNSVRIPVRWYTGVDSKLTGVKADVDLAIKQGLAVIINYHHYETMHEAAKSYPGGNYPSEKQNYLSVWKRVAQTFSSYPADKLVFEIYNEPRSISQAAVDDLMLSAYEVIRAAAPNHTIMFEGNDYAKFSQVSKVTLPEDGNIIFTGHYYEPYTYSHQGSHGNGCAGDAAYMSRAASDMKSYVDRAMIAYPDVNGGHVPLNMGEFGIAKVCGVTDAKRTEWTKLAVQAAEASNMSWHYWCFKNCGGFEAWNGSWMSGFLSAFGLK